MAENISFFRAEDLQAALDLVELFNRQETGDKNARTVAVYRYDPFYGYHWFNFESHPHYKEYYDVDNCEDCSKCNKCSDEDRETCEERWIECHRWVPTKHVPVVVPSGVNIKTGPHNEVWFGHMGEGLRRYAGSYLRVDTHITYVIEKKDENKE